MTDLDLERLGDVWRQQPDPEELDRLRRTALAVSRRARLQQVLDLVAAVVVASVVLFLVVSSGRTGTVLMGCAAILVLLVSHVRQRRMRQIELRSLSGTTEDMLDQSIERVETAVRHHRFSLIAIGPVLALALLFAATAEEDGALLGAVSGAPLLRAVWFGVALALIAGIPLFLLFAVRRGRRELERLWAMRNSYRAEGEDLAGE